MVLCCFSSISIAVGFRSSPMADTQISLRLREMQPLRPVGTRCAPGRGKDCSFCISQMLARRRRRIGQGWQGGAVKSPTACNRPGYPHRSRQCYLVTLWPQTSSFSVVTIRSSRFSIGLLFVKTCGQELLTRFTSTIDSVRVPDVGLKHVVTIVCGTFTAIPACAAWS